MTKYKNNAVKGSGLSNEDFKHFIAVTMLLEEAIGELWKLHRIFINKGMDKTSIHSFLVKQQFKLRMILQQLLEKEI
jgi:hypothetical protein